jgi:imidazolonepropionase
MPPRASSLVRGAAQIWDGRRLRSGEAVLIREGRVAWIGPQSQAPSADEVIEASDGILMPGLVDCHTHLVHAGSRLGDFLRRLEGVSYAELLEGGGGIHVTVAATRAASETELERLLSQRLQRWLELGVTTVEIKGGYGLGVEEEARLLRVARAVGGRIRVVTTFLGAHALPPHRERSDYVREVIEEQLPVCAPLADAIDVYCDRGAFTLEEAERILIAGKSYGLKLRIHAEQVSHTGAAAMAARLGALSADHLERVDAAGIAAMAAAGTVAVLLPGAMLHLRDPAPPVAALRRAGVPMAVATDFNPGSSPVADLWSCATLACLTMGLHVEEALAGITRVAADALGRSDLGRIEVGARADLALFDAPPGERADARVLVQHMGGHRARWVLREGELVGGQLSSKSVSDSCQSGEGG